ncbi:MAG TPA: L-seryl-tRNA(Sec) selenium transferase, partial [Terriglobales bacterium]|nr:L-seryl-tRNA(Sec) selenium transferase [Terriglobales bacterium]
MRTADKSELYRRLPGVDELMRRSEISALAEREGHAAVTDAARAVLSRVREEIGAGTLDSAGVELAVSGLAAAVERQLRHNLQFSLRTVINATGVVLHTNLGRAPLSAAALEHLRNVACTYSNLEFDIEKGERGKRDVHVEKWFARLFASLVAGAESAISTVVVNNNAAAVLLGLNTLAEGGEVVVSRGELVEIGGSFRIPEVMAKSGAKLREVGTTNRTRIADYERAINESTRLLLRVHRSNFQITGFTEQPTVGALVDVGRKRGIPVMEDLGSGALVDLRSLGISGEPGVADSLRAGVDVVTYSGDKLLGGPQAGMLSGKKELIARIRTNPLFRALRVDKLTYAALEATLLAYVRQDYRDIPAVRMLGLKAEEIEKRAEAIRKKLEAGAGRLRLETVEGTSVVGGGAAPAASLPTRVLAVTCDGMSAEELA